jgi:predicted ATPase
VFAYLVLHRHRSVPRDELLEVLWPARAPEAPDAALTALLSRLRSVLPPGALEGRAQLALRLGPDAWIDVEVAAQATDARAALAIAEQPLLPGLEGDWIAERRRELDALVSTLLEAIGDEPALRRLIAREPLRESAYGRLMERLAARGDVARALAVYDELRTRLRDELGVVPGAPLRALSERLLGHGARALPRPPNRTIGRGKEIEEVTARVRAGARLLTLTGPGGVGKTRLALEVAAQLADAHLIRLEALREPHQVAAAVAEGLQVVMLEGETPASALERFLAAKRLVLVLDNFEHLLSAAPLVSRLLATCPGLTVLATSREPLGLQAELVHPVPPLAGADAVELFGERARARDPRVALDSAVADICRRLDGLPLAIELAAARCGLLTPAQIAQRLALGEGPRDAPARQRTLHATLDWSYELLDADEREAFACFAVFAGGATLEAAEAVTGATLDTLDRLVAKSLLARRERLHMLQTIQAYAAERLPPYARERHHRHFRALAEREGAQRALWGPDRHQHLACLDADAANLRAALDWKATPELTAALGWYWLMRERHAEAVVWIDRALASAAPGALRVRLLCLKSWSLWPLARDPEQPAVMDEAEALARSLDDPLPLAEVLYTRAFLEAIAGRRRRVEVLAAEALEHAACDPWESAMAAYAHAIAAPDPAALRERVEHAAARLRACGNVHQSGQLLVAASAVALRQGGDRDARAFAERATPMADTPFLSMVARTNLGYAALLGGDIDPAAAAFREALAICRELVVPPFASQILTGLAAVAALRGDGERAGRLYSAAGAHRYGRPADPLDARLRRAVFDPAGIGDEDDALSLDAAIALALGS